MSENIGIANTVSIRDAGLDEYWLQDQIGINPSILKLGDLEVLAKEKTQSSGGRLDMLLKDPEDDKMFEVEVMLGETDESHIIRTIEYWDNEKRKYPQRQHFPVLVAEKITKRFFNVIHIFSHSIPIIAIQVNLVEVEGKKCLHFSKILDVYEEPEDSSESIHEEHDEKYWQEKAAWSLDAAKTLLELLQPIFSTGKLHFVKNYIAIDFEGNNYIWIRKRSGDKSKVSMWFSKNQLGAAMELLDGAEISYVQKNQSLFFTSDCKTLKQHADVMTKLAEFTKASWKET